MPGREQGANTIFFIHKAEVPQNQYKEVTYGCIVCDYRVGKAEPNRTRLTEEGDKINCPNDCGMPTSDILTVKLLLNSIISKPEAQFMTMDIKNIYLNMPIK